MTSPDRRPTVPIGLADCGVVAIGRGLTEETAPDLARALASGGIRAFEITLNAPEEIALRAIAAVARLDRASGLVIGAGTVLTVDAATRAVDAGATFLVMPHTDLELVAWAAHHGIPALPGACTPTEVLAGWRAGAAAVKVFPACAVGPAFIRELRGPFPDILLVPTGGVSVQNARAFIQAGAIAVGLGSWLIGDGALAGVTSRARQVVRVVRSTRAGGSH